MRTIAVALMAIGVLVAAGGVVGMVASDDGPPAPPSAIETAPERTAEPGGAPSSTTTSPASTSTTTVEQAVRTFVPELVAAIRKGDNDFKFARLHPAVIERYGEKCKDGLSGAQPDFVIDVVSVGVAEPWDWVTDGVTATIVATPVTVKRSSAGGVLIDGVIHLAEAEGEMRWFTDCGTPLSS